MKLCSFVANGTTSVGVVREDGIVDVSAVAHRVDPTLPDAMLGWVRMGDDAVKLLTDLVGQARDGEVVQEGDVRIVSPLPEPPRSALCVAANYRDHVMEAVEAAAARGQTIDPEPYLRAEPGYFTKDPRAMCGPFDDIAVDPDYSTQVDWEVEMAVVIGSEARDVTVEQAMDHVFGYATFNDVSVRDIQRLRSQMWKGKNLRGGSPLGPYIVTKDEYDPADMVLRCWVSGELMQEGRTSSMIHKVPALVADLSRGFVLEPGDVIATGTTVGTGHARNPQRFLQPGDVLETEVEGLGRSRNRIV